MKDQLSSSSIYDTLIRIIIVFLIIGWCIMIIAPFGGIVLWSAIMALAIFPLHQSLSKRLNNSPKIASAIIVITMFVIIIIPSGFLGAALVDEVKELKVMYDEGTLTIPPPPEKVKELPVVGKEMYTFWESSSVNIGNTIVKYQDQLAAMSKNIAQGLLNSVSAGLQLVVAFIIAGILLVIPGTGEAARVFFRKIAGTRGDEFADMTKKTVGSVVKGILGVALILAVLHGLVFMFAGVPFAGLLALGVFVLSILQLPSLILTIPVMIYLFSEQSLTAAIIWTIALIIVGLSDNVLKPILLGKGSPVPMLVIFIGVIGGFILSGFIGLFTGAIILSIGYKLFTGWLDTPDTELNES